MNIWALPCLIALIVSLVVGIVVYLRNKENLLNRLYLYFSITIALISFITFNYLQSETLERAYFWRELGLMWPFILTFQFHLVVTMVDPDVKLPKTTVGLYLSSLIIILIQLIPIDSPSIMIKEYYGWNGISAKNDTRGIIIAIYSMILAFVPIFIVVRHLVTFTGKKRKLAIAFLFGLCVPTFYSMVIYIILPRFSITAPPLTSLVICISTLFFGFAILRYQLFTINPVSAANNIVSMMPDLLVLLNGEEKIVSVNKALVTLLHYSEKEIIGNSMHKLLGNSDSNKFLSFGTHIRQGTANDLQIILKTKEGEDIPASLSASLLTDNHGELAGFLCLGRDIRQTKNIENELRKAKEKADIASKAKSQFLANMSHEIRTPMNAVIGFGDLLKNTGLSSQQQEYVDTMCMSGELLISLINDILDISKIESDKVTLEEIDFNLEQLIGSVLKILRSRIGEKTIDLNLRYGAHVPRSFLGDPTRIRQVFINLVSNAIKFTEKGDITVSVSCMPQIDKQPFQILVSVTDTGIGIPKDKQEQIFDAFVQVDSSTTRKYGGSGLGLSITKGLVRLMQGELTVQSVCGFGSSFNFSMYLKPGVETFQEGISFVDLESLKGKKVLIVEDNMLNQKLMKLVLDQLGCTVEMANNGQEAIDKVKQNYYSIILMDIQMPLMGGIEAATILRNEIKCTTPIIALTAHALKEDQDSCMSAGMDDFVTKPISGETLKEKILFWASISHDQTTA